MSIKSNKKWKKENLPDEINLDPYSYSPGKAKFLGPIVTLFGIYSIYYFFTHLDIMFKEGYTLFTKIFISLVPWAILGVGIWWIYDGWFKNRKVSY